MGFYGEIRPMIRALSEFIPFAMVLAVGFVLGFYTHKGYRIVFAKPDINECRIECKKMGSDAMVTEVKGNSHCACIYELEVQDDHYEWEKKR